MSRYLLGASGKYPSSDKRSYTVYLYMDESGSFHEGKYTVVIAILATNTTREIEHCIKRTRQRKLRKHLLPELSGYEAKPSVLRYALREIAKCSPKIFAIIVQGSGITKSPNDMYNEAAGILIRECCRRVTITELIVDKRNDKKTRFLFDEYVMEVVGKDIKIRHEDSRREPAIQAVDLVAYAIRLKYQHGETEYYDLIKEKVAWKGGP